jgi:hypothetical protein
MHSHKRWEEPEMSRFTGVAIDGDAFDAMLDGRPVSVPAVLCESVDGRVRFGPAQAVGEQEFRDFAGRVGDPVPVIGSAGGGRLGADLVAEAVGRLAREAGEPADLVVAYPASWDGHRAGVLRSALSCTVDRARVRVVSRPVAALAASGAHGPVLVVDAGRLGTEVSLVDGGRVVETTAVDAFGGEALDALLAGHLLAQSPRPLDRSARRTLPAHCASVRAELAGQAATVAELPGGPVRVVRAEFEELIREPVAAVVSAVAAALARTPVEAVLLAGEAAGTPLLREALSARTATRVLTSGDPRWTVVVGAAALAERQSATAPARPDGRGTAPRIGPLTSADRTAPPAGPAEQTWPSLRRAAQQAPATPARQGPATRAPEPAAHRPAAATHAPRPTASQPAQPHRSAARPPGVLLAERPAPEYRPRPDSGPKHRIRTAIIAAAAGLAVLVGGGAAVSGGGHGGGMGFHARG